MKSNKQWFKNAIFYEVSIKSFYDRNGDGIGDFIGLSEKLDYLKDLGIDCLWILPYYPSPLKDDGYDISDYYNIHPDIGTLADFEYFIEKAHSLGIRVIADLVLNHTSDQHDWFKESRKSINSSKRHYYVWNKTNQKYLDVPIIFFDTEDSNWKYDENTSEYYWHRFYSSQPDLNFDSEEVQSEMLRVVDFWLKKGLDGFRVDAVPYLFEKEGTSCENLKETHQYIKRLRVYIDENYKGGEKVLLAEANMIPEELILYFGDNNDEFHMAFHFPLMTNIFLAVAKENPKAIIPIIKNLINVPNSCQWATFLRNHDELTLALVDEDTRNFMWKYYAPQPQMKSNLGIRRRLAPLFNNDMQKIKMVNSLLFSLPGSPVIYYGDEIGMGDLISLEDRNGIRTPMQWINKPNAGFSVADENDLIFPMINDEVYGFQNVNVEDQLNDENSLLNFMKSLIKYRKRHPFLGYGDIDIIDNNNNNVLVFHRSHKHEGFVVIHNFSKNTQSASFKLKSNKQNFLSDVFSQLEVSIAETNEIRIDLDPYQFLWLYYYK